MTVFFRSIFIDLYNRVENMILDLERRDMVSEIASYFKNQTVVKLTKLKSEINEITNYGLLEERLFTINLTIKYNSLNDYLLELELYCYIPLINYSDKAEGYFEKLIKAIYNETKCNQPIPFVTTSSDSDTYYWAKTKFRMIAVPKGEEKYLLNLSDLFHEMGHFIFEQYGEHLISSHTPKVTSYFDELVKTYRKKVDPKKKLSKARDMWEDFWSEELACDLIATYFVGPAYAWTNMKNCAVHSNGNNIYSHSDPFKHHPADAARMSAILKMLELIDCKDDIAPIKKAWDGFLAIMHNDKMELFDKMYPDELITSIAENVYEGCTILALQSFPQQIKNYTEPISKVINAAWNKIRTEPQEYAQWEIGEIENLQSRNM